MADDHGFWQNSNAAAAFNNDEFDLEPYQFDTDIFKDTIDEDKKKKIVQPVVETISPILTVSIPPFYKNDFYDSLNMGGSLNGSIGNSSYSLEESDALSPNSLLSSIDSANVIRPLESERDIDTTTILQQQGLPTLNSTSSFISPDQFTTQNRDTNASLQNYKRLPRQGRYSHPTVESSPETTIHRPAGPSSIASSCSVSPASPAGNVALGEHKKVSDSRLSAQGLAKVLNLDSPEEALKRERYILDIFENELHYPLGYKTWVRDTFKDYRVKLIDQLHERVKHRYPEYDHSVLETIIRRATYYMMQSRLRRERRARAKGVKLSRSTANTP